MSTLSAVEKLLLRTGPGVAAYGMASSADLARPSLKGIRRISDSDIPGLYDAAGISPDYPTLVIPGMNQAGAGRARDVVRGVTAMENEGVIPRATAKKLVNLVRKHKGAISTDPKFMIPAIMAHEAGHVAMSKEPVLGPIQDAASYSGISRLLGWLPLLGMLVPKFRTPKGMMTMAGLSASTAVPKLITEYGASSKARSTMDKLDMDPEQLSRNRKALNSAYMTYLLGMLGPATGLAGAAGYAKLRGLKRF